MRYRPLSPRERVGVRGDSGPSHIGRVPVRPFSEMARRQVTLLHRFRPGSTLEDSPPIYRWEYMQQSGLGPVGTVEPLFFNRGVARSNLFRRALRSLNSTPKHSLRVPPEGILFAFQSSLRDYRFTYALNPSSELPGYFRQPLWGSPFYREYSRSPNPPQCTAALLLPDAKQILSKDHDGTTSITHCWKAQRTSWAFSCRCVHRVVVVRKIFSHHEVREGRIRRHALKRIRDAPQAPRIVRRHKGPRRFFPVIVSVVQPS